MKVRKQPVEVEAVRFEGIKGQDIDFGPDDSAPEWLPIALEQGVIIIHPVFSENRLQVHTSEGAMIADKGDWIICGVEGELYPCKPSIFEATYVQIDGSPVPSIFDQVG